MKAEVANGPKRARRGRDSISVSNEDPGLDPEAFELRLFLSVDIVGSTALKHRRNHHELYRRYKDMMSVVDAAVASGDGTTATRAKIEDRVLMNLSALELDWANIVERCFQDFHTAFFVEVEARSADCPETLFRPYERQPWKAIGDELVYSFQLRSVQHGHSLLTAFLRTVRGQDASWAPKARPEIRLKSSAWVAGFPVNNRKVTLPIWQRDSGKLPKDSPWPGIDYLGPDMDIGFRIGKCTYSAMCVVALSLAEFLASDQKVANKALLKVVGWEPLKGVWGDQPYPVIWAELGGEVRDGRDARIDPSSEAECRYIGAWRSAATNAREAHHLKDELAAIRDALPSSFGATIPYVPGSGAHSPAEKGHTEIKRLVGRVQQIQRTARDQSSPTAAVSVGSSAIPQATLQGLDKKLPES